MNRLFVEETRKDQTQQIYRDGGNCALGRQILPIEVVNASDTSVGHHEFIGKLGYAYLHGGKYWASGGGWQGVDLKSVVRSQKRGSEYSVFSVQSSAVRVWARMSRTLARTWSAEIESMQRKSIGHSRRKQGEQGTFEVSKRCLVSAGSPGPVRV